MPYKLEMLKELPVITWQTVKTYETRDEVLDVLERVKEKRERKLFDICVSEFDENGRIVYLAPARQWLDEQEKLNQLAMEELYE